MIITSLPELAAERGAGMRVLLVTQYFWPENFRINDVARSLGQRQVVVDVLTGKPNYPDGVVFSGYRAGGCTHEVHDGNEVHRMPLVPRGRGGLRLALNYLSFIITGLLMAPLMLRGRTYDVVFVYAPSPILKTIPAIFLGWLKGAPVVLWVQDLWPASLSATGHVKNVHVLKLVEHVVRFIYRRVDLLLVQSEAFVAPVRALAGNTPIVYFPNSVDDSFTAPASVPAPPVPGMNAPFPVLFAGNIGNAQAVEVIVDAARLLRAFPAIQFVVVGDGSRRAWMEQEVARLGLDNLHLPGRFPVETMPALMQQAAALLVTLADQEIFRQTIPSKVQAYLASGRPIVACLNGEGADLVVRAGAGVAVPAENGQALADAVLALHHRPASERQAMGRLGAQYFQDHFAHEMLVDRLVELLADCRAKRAGQAISAR
jgi:glycosyltransferase involved in cell wall biosynthesis